ncbi:MAG: Alkane monooxygenase [Sphingomonadales bacterium]|nr:Alkane monooxygenase [Sphingomonadales bacterium]
MTRRRIILNAFHMNSISHLMHGLWVQKGNRQADYTTLDAWVELARILERGRFDALFLADPFGIHDVYGASRDAAIKWGVHVPQNDPLVLVSALAHATEHLGFAVTSSIVQEHPFNFARRMTTLDHLTKGRIGWNIVSSWVETSWKNLGHSGFPPHEERYARADEYAEVVYKLLEGSWEDGAVIRDRETGIYTDPSKVHDIDHHGRFYDVPGPHFSEPSPQRTPLLFQAGHSERGKHFTARHAEGAFIGAPTAELAARHISDVREIAGKLGRQREDIIFFTSAAVIVGGTEEEAQRKARDIDEQLQVEALLVSRSDQLKYDLKGLDPDARLDGLDFSKQPLDFRAKFEGFRAEGLTLAQAMRKSATRRVIGTPEQIADVFERWQDAGVDGWNLSYATTPGSFVEFIDGVVPELQRRGLVQTEYSPGTYREKLFPGRGARVNARHFAASFRRGEGVAAR